MVTVKVPTTHRHHRGVPLKSAKERMDVISAYQQVGSYRGAAELCGTTPKTVKRVETHWFRWRLGLLDFDQGLVGPFCSVEDGFELCGR